MPQSTPNTPTKLDSIRKALRGMLGEFPQGFNRGASAGLLGWPGDMAYMLDTARRVVTGERTQPPAEEYLGTTDRIAKDAGYPIPQSFSGQLGSAIGGMLSPSPSDLARLAPVLAAIPALKSARAASALDDLPMDEASRMARADELFPIEAYHGSNRIDRVLEKPGLNPKRATSGPMPFFTDTPEVASGYASGKADTSRLAEYDSDYSDWFKVRPPGARTDKPLDQAWAYLPPEERRRITDALGQIGYVDEEYTVIGKGADNVGGAGRDHWEHLLKESRGNALRAAKELWLSSGNLFDREEQFLDVLKAAGVDGVRYDSPHMTQSGILPARLRMTRPFETTPENVSAILPAIRQAAKRKRGKGRGVDQWDKTSVSGADYVERLENDIANGTTHAWTSIPDWVTDVLRENGYDGIKDLGGKYGGPGHTVYIPFAPNQVRSRFAKFDPRKAGSDDLLAGAAGLGLGGMLWADYEKQKRKGMLD